MSIPASTQPGDSWVSSRATERVQDDLAGIPGDEWAGMAAELASLPNGGDPGTGEPSAPLGTKRPRTSDWGESGSRHSSYGDRRSLFQYMEELGSIPMLTKRGEQQIGRRIEDGHVEIRGALLTAPLGIIDLLGLDTRGAYQKGDLIPSRLSSEEVVQIEAKRARWRELVAARNELLCTDSAGSDRSGCRPWGWHARYEWIAEQIYLLGREIPLSLRQVRSIAETCKAAARRLKTPVTNEEAEAIEGRMHLSADEVRRIDESIRHGEAVLRQAVAEMVEANLRLVFRLARSHANRGLPFLDLLQEGNLGLMEAAERFDYRRGYKFSTYATWWIRVTVARAVTMQARMIRLPVYLDEEVSRAHRATGALMQQLGRRPTAAEIAEYSDVPLPRLQQLSELRAWPLSLDAPVGEEGSALFAEFVADAHAEHPEELVDTFLVRDRLQEALSELSEREQYVLRLRFGLGRRGRQSLQAVGRELGVSRERVRQIEKRALQKLCDSEVMACLREAVTG